ncbi:class I SAM-dependent methyltransferase [Asanoa iriomotensis]|uniref:Methyltransferase domain-containing protein n=1 Tax=Asanoa iriomotensis TaxID=234613 RepID=A0ABQ4CAT5_9ACTN|nr:class I SAM-dependent methyltransferase [Asanoa iriomotensis]GIF59877.1 hypothetical protein Air01nite_59720 [Asanoa iriomotensis]
MEQRNAGRVFGEVVDLYDRVRQPYPAALIDDVLAYSRLDGRRALEVGAGTGRATIPFATRGVPVVAVEPDDAMADALSRRAGAGVEVVRGAFEEFRPAERFGLLFSAEAWHWTVPQTRWSLAADALAPGAAIALFWHSERVDEPTLRDNMLRVIAEHAPTVVVHDEPVGQDQAWQRWPGSELSVQPAFAHFTSRHYRTRRTVPAADYLGLTQTRSQFRTLPPPDQQALVAALTDVFDDEVPLAIETTLLLARRTHD